MAYRYLTVKINGKTKLLHRHLMEQHLGRALAPTEHVHHKNGDRKDNRLDNLELVGGYQHICQHAEERRVWPRTKVCGVCGVEYEPHRTKRKRSLTCSRTCAYAMRVQSRLATEAARRAR